MTLANLKKYSYFLRKFRNSLQLISAMRNNTPCGQAVLWNGTRLVHPENRSGFAGTILEVWYERCYTTNGFYTPKDGDVIMDVGAHVGLFSLLMTAMNPSCRVVAFEPSTENYPCLTYNLCSAVGSVQAHNMALGGECAWGTAVAKTDRSIDHQIQIVSDESKENAIQIITLNDACTIADAPQFALLKMDIEGHEHDVFHSASDETINRFDRIVMEYHDHLRPGTLKLVKRRLEPFYDIQVEPTEDRGYGVLLATKK